MRHLLPHTAGLFDYASDSSTTPPTRPTPLHEWTRARATAVRSRPRSPARAARARAFHYSDTGYVLLGEIIERVTGETLPAPPSAAPALRSPRPRPTPTGRSSSRHRPASGRGPVLRTRLRQHRRSTRRTTSTAAAAWCRPSTTSRRFSRALFHGKVFDKTRDTRTMTKVSGPGRKDGAAMGLFARRRRRALLQARPATGARRPVLPAPGSPFARTINQADDAELRLPTPRAGDRQGSRSPREAIALALAPPPPPSARWHAEPHMLRLDVPTAELGAIRIGEA